MTYLYTTITTLLLCCAIYAVDRRRAERVEKAKQLARRIEEAREPWTSTTTQIH